MSINDNKDLFLKNVFTLINGVVLAQLINILMSPVLSRLYSPSEFGKFAVINSIVIIFASIVNGKYELAVMIEKKLSNSRALFDFSYFLNITITLVFGILFVLGKQLNLFNIEISLTFLSLTIFLIIGFSNNSLINIWLNKFSLYKEISIMRIIYSASYAILSIILGILSFNSLGLIISMLIASMLQNFYGYFIILKRTDYFEYSYSFKDIKLMSKEHLAFPKFTMPTFFFNGMSTQLPIILFSVLFSTEVSGWYSMTTRILNVPMMILGNAIGNVYFREISELKIKNDLKGIRYLTTDILKKLTIIGSLVMGFVLIFGEDVFSLLLGKDWSNAGVYAQYFAPWYLMILLTSPISHIFNVFAKQKQNFYINLCVFTVRISIIFLCSSLAVGQDLTVLIFGITGYFLLSIMNILTLKIIKVNYIIIFLRINIMFLMIVSIFVMFSVLLNFIL